MNGGITDTTASADVFLSYSRTDEPRARQIIDFLEAEGFTVWWDGMLEAGTVFTRSTETALDQAAAVVVLWSKTSIDSHWVRDEAQSGREDGRMVPVRIDEVMPPLGFRQFQAVDLSKWNGERDSPEITSVRDAVARLVGHETPSAPAPPAKFYRSPAAEKSKSALRPLVIGVAAIVTLLAAFGIYSSFSGEDAQDSSIAILEFDNLSDDPEQAYFSTGLSEELRQVLSQSSALQVMGQASTEEASGDGRDAQQIADALGVRYLLDGSVRRAENTVRVTVQLIDSTTGFDVWSDSYDRSLDDIFAVQTEIAGQVANALRLQMAEGEHADFGSRRGGTANAEAYDAYLRGKNLYDLAIDEATDRAALRSFEEAVTLDPDYGAAWAALARAQTVIANSYASDTPREEAYAEAIASAQRGVETAPNLAAAHAALGFAYFNGRLDASGAEAPFQRAYQLGAGDADILQLVATFNARTGNFEQAKQAINSAIELDPLNALSRRSSALIHYAAGDFETARAAVEQALELNPDMRVLNRILGDIAYLEGDYQAALEFYEREASRLGGLTGLAITLPRLGDTEGGRQALADLREENADNSLYQEAQIAAQSGDIPLALDLIEAAYAANDSGLVYLRNDPLLAPLRSEERYQNVLRRMGFTLP